MKVEQILQTKGAQVYAVHDTDEIRRAVNLLNDKNIGAVVVQNRDEDVVGILSERDIVRRLGKGDAGALGESVASLMTKDPVTVEPDSELDDVMSIMSERRIRHLPVCKGRKLCGVVSIGDVVKRKIDLALREAQELKDYIST